MTAVAFRWPVVARPAGPDRGPATAMSVHSPLLVGRFSGLPGAGALRIL